MDNRNISDVKTKEITFEVVKTAWESATHEQKYGVKPARALSDVIESLTGRSCYSPKYLGKDDGNGYYRIKRAFLKHTDSLEKSGHLRCKSYGRRFDRVAYAWQSEEEIAKQHAIREETTRATEAAVQAAEIFVSSLLESLPNDHLDRGDIRAVIVKAVGMALDKDREEHEEEEEE